MKRMLSFLISVCMIFFLIACVNEKAAASPAVNNQRTALEDQAEMTISVTANGKTTVFELNNSQAAKDLYKQLPLSINVENFGGNEKIFYPPNKLKTADTPLASNNKVGSLAYYAPWGDVVMFYGNFGSASGLYELGHSVSGEQYIKDMSGTIRIEKN